MDDTLIYLDNAATTLQKPPGVVRALVHALGVCGNPGRGAHEPTLEAGRTVFAARSQVARLLGVEDPRRVAFFFNATDALNAAIHGMITPGMKVVTTAAEHNAVLRPLYRAQQSLSITLEIVPARSDGRIPLEDLVASITPEVGLVVVSHASNVTGQVIDIAAVAARAHEVGARILVDAAQTAGVLPIACDAWQIDALAFTGHKSLFGPQGTGGLCLQPDVTCAPWRCGGDGTHSTSRTQPAQMPDCLEAGTPNVCGLAGLAAGVSYILDRGLADIGRHDSQIMARLLEGLTPLTSCGLSLYGVDLNNMEIPRVPVLSFALDGMDAAKVSDVLMQTYRICTRPGLHCAPLIHQALQTGAAGTVRISASALTCEAEIDALISALTHMLKKS